MSSPPVTTATPHDANVSNIKSEEQHPAFDGNATVAAAHTTLPLFFPQSWAPTLPIFPFAMPSALYNDPLMVQQKSTRPIQHGRTQSGQSNSPRYSSAINYKTELCRTFYSNGHCRYGATCQFAHGTPELRSRIFNGKYKTTICLSFFNTKTCSFGSRCKYLHDDFRLRFGPQQFVLISPSDNVIRFEATVEPNRLQQLIQLTFCQFNQRAILTHQHAMRQQRNGSNTCDGSVADLSTKPANDLPLDQHCENHDEYSVPSPMTSIPTQSHSSNSTIFPDYQALAALSDLSRSLIYSLPVSVPSPFAAVSNQGLQLITMQPPQRPYQTTQFTQSPIEYIQQYMSAPVADNGHHNT